MQSPEQIIAERAARVLHAHSINAQGFAIRTVEALRDAGFLVLSERKVWEYVRERALADEAVEAASRGFEPSTWEAFDAGRGREYEQTDALADAHTAVAAALDAAERGTDA